MTTPANGRSCVDSIVIDPRFQGPPHSGNGGYTCGRLAAYIDGPAKVRLHVPPPLGREMRIERDADGHIRLLDDETLIAEAWRSTVDVLIPPAPSFSAASAAGERFRGFEDHFYPSCFVCGPERTQGEGLRIFAGPLEDNSAPDSLMPGACACLWNAEAFRDGENFVRPEILWAALDCPGGFSFDAPEQGSILLGELTAHLFEPAPADTSYALLAWEISRKGRKHHTGTAIFSEAGLCHGIARGTWFEVPN